MNWWTNLVAENPMLIEIQRFRRKFFMASGSQTQAAIVLGLSLLCYLGLLSMVISNLGDFPPIALIYMHLGLFTIVAPSSLYAAIAGEREKRTWDLLVVAPITKAQIVAGKFIGALAGIGAGSLFFIIPIILTAATYSQQDMAFLDAMLAELMVLAFLVLICAFTLFVSARVDRPYTALGIVIGTLALVLAVIPILLSVMFRMQDTDGLLLFHPFVALGHMAFDDTNYRPAGGIPREFYGWPQIAAYLFLTVAFVSWTVRTLRYVDGEPNSA